MRLMITSLVYRFRPFLHIRGAIGLMRILASPFFLRTRRSGHAAALVAVAALLSGCAAVDQFREDPPNWLTPYRPDIGQGNFISQDMVERLSQGMAREQVRAILGTPLLVDPFRDNRWEYVFDIRRGDGQRERRRFFVRFEGDRLVEWGGDPLPKASADALLPLRPAR